jgi:hypothetical protein
MRNEHRKIPRYTKLILIINFDSKGNFRKANRIVYLINGQNDRIKTHGINKKAGVINRM